MFNESDDTPIRQKSAITMNKALEIITNEGYYSLKIESQ